MIVGIVGRKQSGKSTVAKLFKTENTAIVPMAEPLKAMLEAAGVPKSALYGTEEEKNTPLEILGGKTGRFAMQTLGSEWGRDMIDVSLWVNMWKAKAKFLSEDGVDIICDDIRRYDEAVAVEKMGGHLIMITRASEQPVDSHQSERYIEQLPFHHKIENDGTLEELEAKIKKVMEAIHEREAKKGKEV